MTNAERLALLALTGFAAAGGYGAGLLAVKVGFSVPVAFSVWTAALGATLGLMAEVSDSMKDD